MANKTNLTILLIMIEVFLLTINNVVNAITVIFVALQVVQSYLILKEER